MEGGPGRQPHSISEEEGLRPLLFLLEIGPPRFILQAAAWGLYLRSYEPYIFQVARVLLSFPSFQFARGDGNTSPLFYLTILRNVYPNNRMSACKCSSVGTFPTEIVRGDAVHWLFEFKDNCGTAVDASGWEIWLIVKKSTSDTFENAVLRVRKQVPTDTNSAAGKVVVSIPSSETAKLEVGSYHYEFKRVLPGNPPDVWTFKHSGSAKKFYVVPGTFINSI